MQDWDPVRGTSTIELLLRLAATNIVHALRQKCGVQANPEFTYREFKHAFREYIIYSDSSFADQLPIFDEGVVEVEPLRVADSHLLLHVKSIGSP